MATIDERPYGPDMTDEERAAIRAHVYVVEDRIIMLRELPVVTAESIDVMFDHNELLAEGWDLFVEIVDLSRAVRPPPEVRAALRPRLAKLFAPRVHHCACIMENNFIFQAVATFIFRSLGIRSVSFHRTEEDALVTARRYRDQLPPL